MTHWDYVGEYPISLGGLYYQPFLPCRAVNIKEIDDSTVSIEVLQVTSWKPLITDSVSSEIFDHSTADLEDYIKRRYLHE